jgi:transcription elongation GreA/GreB family factor
MMSRAFVKEDTDAPPLPPPERPISPAPNRVTRRGARLINEAIATLEHNLAADPDAAAVPLLRRDLRYWHARHASMQIVHPDPALAFVGLGATVTIRRTATTSTLTIVGEDEADPAAGRIVWTAPLARALEAAEPGDTIDVVAGGHIEPVTVLSVAPSREV